MRIKINKKILTVIAYCVVLIGPICSTIYTKNKTIDALEKELYRYSLYFTTNDIRNWTPYEYHYEDKELFVHYKYSNRVSGEIYKRSKKFTNVNYFEIYPENNTLYIEGYSKVKYDFYGRFDVFAFKRSHQYRTLKAWANKNFPYIPFERYAEIDEQPTLTRYINIKEDAINKWLNGRSYKEAFEKEPYNVQKCFYNIVFSSLLFIKENGDIYFDDHPYLYSNAPTDGSPHDIILITEDTTVEDLEK